MTSSDFIVWVCIGTAVAAIWVESTALAAGSVGVIAGMALSEYVNRS
jgi:hypothetical protein